MMKTKFILFGALTAVLFTTSCKKTNVTAINPPTKSNTNNSNNGRIITNNVDLYDYIGQQHNALLTTMLNDYDNASPTPPTTTDINNLIANDADNYFTTNNNNSNYSTQTYDAQLRADILGTTTEIVLPGVSSELIDYTDDLQAILNDACTNDLTATDFGTLVDNYYDSHLDNLSSSTDQLGLTAFASTLKYSYAFWTNYNNNSAHKSSSSQNKESHVDKGAVVFADAVGAIHGAVSGAVSGSILGAAGAFLFGATCAICDGAAASAADVLSQEALHHIRH